MTLKQLWCGVTTGHLKARLKAMIAPTFPENGVVRHVLGPVPVVTQPFDHKAHAATRKRGPNGQFLPHIGLPQKKIKAWRKRIRKKTTRRKK